MTNQQVKKQILIAEDDPLISKMYKTKLISEGYDVLAAFDGEAAFSLATNNSPSLILLDIMMPKLSGLDMLSKYRSTKEGKETPVIVLSNLSNQEEIEKAKSLGAKEYLVKADHTPSQVIAKIKQYI